MADLWVRFSGLWKLEPLPRVSGPLISLTLLEQPKERQLTNKTPHVQGDPRVRGAPFFRGQKVSHRLACRPAGLWAPGLDRAGPWGGVSRPVTLCLLCVPEAGSASIAGVGAEG